MSLLFYENQLRFQPDKNNELPDCNVNNCHVTSLAKQPPAQFDLLSYSKKLGKPPSASSQNNNSPKIPSNLVKQNTTTISATSTSTSLAEKDEREQLARIVSEKEKLLFNARNEYDQQYETFFTVTKKFQLEKLNNLKVKLK